MRQHALKILSNRKYFYRCSDASLNDRVYFGVLSQILDDAILTDG